MHYMTKINEMHYHSYTCCREIGLKVDCSNNALIFALVTKEHMQPPPLTQYIYGVHLMCNVKRKLYPEGTMCLITLQASLPGSSVVSLDCISLCLFPGSLSKLYVRINPQSKIFALTTYILSDFI